MYKGFEPSASSAGQLSCYAEPIKVNLITSPITSCSLMMCGSWRCAGATYQSYWVPGMTMENEFGHLQASLSSLRLTTAFYCNLFAWCFVREGCYIRRSRMRSPEELLLSPVLCASEVSESSCEWHYGRWTPRTPCICCLESRSSSSHASLILANFQSLPTACGSSTGSPGWFRRLLLLPLCTAMPKSPAGEQDWIRNEAHDRPCKALKTVAACTTEIVIIQCLYLITPCLLKAATPMQLIH